MMKLQLCLLFVLLVVVVLVHSETDHSSVDPPQTWALLVSGSGGPRSSFTNDYWMQSTVYHAYRTLLLKGVPAQTIVHMNYNDVVWSRDNNVPGSLITQPGGTNWYPGVTVDYSDSEVSAEVFLKVLTGNKTGVAQLLGRPGRVIESGARDTIFIYLVDHGSLGGLFHFPSSVLGAQQFQTVLTQMHRDRRYSRMVIYMEACYSGTMFEDLPDYIDVMAVTSAKPQEMSYGCCWDYMRQAFVGGSWDNAWTYDTDSSDVGKRTFFKQYIAMLEKCSPSRTCSPSLYGHLGFLKLDLREFMGSASSNGEGFSKFANLNKTSVPATRETLPSVPTCLGHLPYVKTETTVMYGDVDLVHPPLDMLEIATVARRLLEVPGDNVQQRRALESRLRRLDDTRKQARDFFVSLVSASVGHAKARWMMSQNHPDVKKLSQNHPDVKKLSQNHPDVKKPECYKSAVELFPECCPGLDHRSHVFVRRNFDWLIHLCNELDSAVVLNNVRKTARLTPACWS